MSGNASGKPALLNTRVLLVEDSADNQLLIGQILRRNGATVTFANDGAEGVAKALGADFDVVLMDIQMPIMDGYEAISKLRESGYTKPIYALTAHAMSEERKKTMNAGFNGHLTKPLNFAELIQTVSKYATIEEDK